MTQIMTQALKNTVFSGVLEPSQSSSSPVSRTKALKTISFQGFFYVLNPLKKGSMSNVGVRIGGKQNPGSKGSGTSEAECNAL